MVDGSGAAKRRVHFRSRGSRPLCGRRLGGLLTKSRHSVTCGACRAVLARGVRNESVQAIDDSATRPPAQIGQMTLNRPAVGWLVAAALAGVIAWQLLSAFTDQRPTATRPNVSVPLSGQNVDVPATMQAGRLAEQQRRMREYVDCKARNAEERARNHSYMLPTICVPP